MLMVTVPLTHPMPSRALQRRPKFVLMVGERALQGNGRRWWGVNPSSQVNQHGIVHSTRGSTVGSIGRTGHVVDKPRTWTARILHR